MPILRTEERHCQTCLHKIDSLSDAKNNESPKAGDIAICMYCGQISTIDADMNLIPMPQEELNELKVEEVEAYEILYKASMLIKNKIPEN
jgi:hypothetical protein